MKLKYLMRKVSHKIFVMTDNDYNLNMKTDGEFHLISELINEAPSDSIFFDIGAEKGDWTYFVRNKRHDLYIHLFDPNEETLEIRQNRFIGDKKIVINTCAVGNNTEDIEFFVDTYSLHRRRSVNRPGENLTIVKSIKLDDYIKKNNIEEVFFIKMDIEGHELFALQGAIESLKKGKIKYIQFEYGACDIDSRTYLKDFYDLINDYNYKIGKIHPNHVENIANYDRLRENFYDSNWLISRIG